jgi:hypothetical protein
MGEMIFDSRLRDFRLRKRALAGATRSRTLGLFASNRSADFLRYPPEGFVASAIENPAIENRKSND